VTVDGATLFVLPLSDVYLSLRQGVVDAITMPFDLLQPMKFGEVAKEMMMLRDYPQFLPLMISEQKWQSLSDEQRKALTESADVAGNFYNEQIAGNVEKWKADLAALGVKVHLLDGRESLLHYARWMVAHEAPKTVGLGAEISALIQEHCFLYLEAPVQRVTGFDVVMPYFLGREQPPAPMLTTVPGEPSLSMIVMLALVAAVAIFFSSFSTPWVLSALISTPRDATSSPNSSSSPRSSWGSSAGG